MQVLFYIVEIRRKQIWKIRVHLYGNPFKNPYIRMMLPMIIPVFIGSAINEINTMVGRALASGMQTGSVVALDYATKINLLVVGVIMGGLLTVYYPKLAKLALSNDRESFREFAGKMVSVTAFVFLPLTIEVLLFHRGIISLLFERGKFNAASTDMTSAVLFFVAFGLLGMGIREILTKIYYSMHETRIPMLNSMFCAGVSIVLSLILSHYMGITGIAAAISFAVLLSAVLLCMDIVRKHWIIVSWMNLSRLVLPTISLYACQAILIDMLGFTLSVHSTLGEFADFFVTLICGSLTYFVVAYLVGFKELRELARKIQKRISQGKEE